MRRTALPILVVALVIAACGDERTPARPDSAIAVVPDSATTATATAVPSRWDTGFGPALFTATNGDIDAVAPDITDSTFADTAAWTAVSLGGVSQAEFFSRGGRVAIVPLATTASHLAPDLSNSCVSWPSVGSADALRAQWVVGFAPGHAVAIALDSIESLARADSARLAADVARIASQIPNDTAVAFAGLPFTVRTAYRLRLAGDTTALIAELTRHIGQEADPREQHVFLVAERVSSTAAWTLAWHTRSSGPEDEVETREL